MTRVELMIIVLIVLVEILILSYHPIDKKEMKSLLEENIELKSKLSLLKRTNKSLRQKLKELTVYKVDVTFYTPRKVECDKDPYKNALNKKVVVGRDVAVSRDLIHLLGKYVYIEGYGVKKVVDIMNGRYKRTVDILVGGLKLAKKLGRKKNVNLKLVILSDYLK